MTRDTVAGESPRYSARNFKLTDCAEWPPRGRAGAPPLLYVGLALMFAVSIRDLVAPAYRRCGPDGCDLPQMSADKAERR